MLHYVLSALAVFYIITITIYSTTYEALQFRRPLYHVVTSKNTRHLPRRPSNYTMLKVRLSVKEVPSWQSCPPAKSSSAIWSMAASKGRSEN